MGLRKLLFLGVAGGMVYAMWQQANEGRPVSAIATPATPEATPAPIARATPQPDLKLIPQAWDDGYLLGKTDAREGRKFDERKARQIGDIHAKGRPDAAEYSRSYSHGYDVGYRERKPD